MNKDGAFPFGKRLSDGINDAINRIGHLIHPCELTSLKQLADYAIENGQRWAPLRAGGKRHPADGFKSYNPAFCGLIPFDDDSEELSTARCLLLLLRMSEARPRGHVSAREWLQKQYLQAKHSKNNSLRKLHQSWDGTLSCLASTQDALLETSLSTTSINAFIQVLNGYFDKQTHAEPGIHTQTESLFEDALRQVERFDGFVEEDNLEKIYAYQAQISAAPDQIDLYDNVTEDIAHQEWEQHLEGPLLPDLERCLTMQEATDVVAYLEKTKLEQSDHLDILALTVLELMIMTGRTRTDVLRAINTISRSNQDEDHSHFKIRRRHWETRVPIKELVGPTQFEDCFDEVTQTTAMPFTKSVARSLPIISKFSGLVLGEKLTNIESKIWAWKKEIRQNVTPRFSERRISATLPTTMYCITGDCRKAQIIAGSDLHHSPSPLHYYLLNSSELQRDYTAALASWGIETVDPIKNEYALVGAPFAALKKTVLQSAIASQKMRVEKSTRNFSNRTFSLDQINSVSAWTAGMFTATTAHRWTHRIQEITRRDILKIDGSSISITSFSDKADDCELFPRLCTLPEMVTDQIDSYISWLVLSVRALRCDKQHKTQRAIKSLNQAICGDGPLFLRAEVINDEWRCFPLLRKDMRSLWPEHPGVQWFRNYFGAHACSSGISPADTCQQMGHSVDGNPYNACDPESPLSVGKKLAPQLEKYLVEIGFEHVVGPTVTLPELSVKSAEQIASAVRTRKGKCTKLEKNQRARPSHNKSIRYQQAQTDTKRIVEYHRPDLFIKDHARHLAVTTNEIRAWLQELYKNQSILQQVDRNRALRRLIKRLRKNNGLSSPNVPMLISNTRPASVVTTHSFEAHRCVTAALNTVQNIESTSNVASTETLLADCAFLLISQAGLTTEDRLLDVINNAYAACVEPGVVDSVLVPVPLRNLSDPQATAEELIPIRGDAALAVAALNRLPHFSVATDDIDRALGQSKIKTLLLPALENKTTTSKNSVLRMLQTVCSEARKISIPGMRTAWEREETTSASVDLERDSSVRFGDLPSVPRQPSPNPKNSFTKPKNVAIRNFSLSDLQSRINPRGKTRGKAAILSVTQSLIENDPGLSITSVLAHWVRSETEKPSIQRIERSTLATYLSSVRQSLVTDLADKDLRDIPPDRIAESFKLAVERTNSASAYQDAMAAIQRLTDVAENLLGVEIEADCEKRNSGNKRAPPFLITSTESAAVIEQLQAAANTSRNSLNSSNDGWYDQSALLSTMILTGAGCRQAECVESAARDAIGHPSCHTLNIRQRYRRSLKTRASCRPLNLRNILPIDHIVQLTQHRDTLIRHRNTYTETDLFRRPGDINSMDISNIVSNRRRSATRRISGVSKASDSRSYRHLYATSSLKSLFSNAELPGVNDWHGLLDFNLPDYIELLPRRAKFRYISRTLGHGYPITTINHYCHLVPFITNQSPCLDGLSPSFQAFLLNKKYSTIKKFRQRNGTRLQAKDRQLNESSVRPYPAAEPRYCSLVDHNHVENPPENSNGTINYQILAEIALRLRQGLELSDIASEIGLSSAFTDSLAARLLIIDKRMDWNFLAGREKRQVGSRSTRLPRASAALGAISKIGAAISSGRLLPQIVLIWAEKQDPSCRTLTFSLDTEILYECIPQGREILSRDGRNAIRSIYPPESNRSIFQLILLSLYLGSRIELGLEHQI